jgi:alpha-beta hydrolase superfamily lysophospholipase
VTHASGSLNGAGQVPIFWQSWTPAGDARGVIVIVHGAGEHSGRYEHVAQALTDDGYAVFALDHRGHGRSGGSRALIDSLDNAVADVDALVDDARVSQPGIPIFMLGHSMGATIALRYAIEYQHRLDGLILSGPLAALESAPAPLRLLGNVLSAIAPKTPLIGVDPTFVSRDQAVVDAYVADPLVHHRKLPARTLAELAATIDRLPETVTAITIPTLIVYGSEDRLCPPAGSQMLAERIAAQDKSIKAYQGLYHEILNEPERDEVLADLRAWLGARLTGASEPSSATGSTI